MLPYRNILFCADGSEISDLAFVQAAALARKYRARLHLLHVSEPRPPGCSGPEEALAALKDRYQARLGGLTDACWTVRPGAAHQEIARYAEEADIDLIVMGADEEESTGPAQYFSTVARVARLTRCPIMAIRNPEKRYTLKD